MRKALWLGLVLLAIAVVAALVALVLGSQVRLLGVSPEGDGRPVPVTAPLRFSFSRPMNADSVAAHVQVQPELTGRWQGQGNDVVFYPDAAWQPGQSYTVTLAAGAASEGGRTLGRGGQWRFQTRPVQILFLGRPEAGAQVRQLELAALDGSEPRQLTDAVWGVWDYAVHPEGAEIVYSVLRGDGGSDLWRMDRDGGRQRLLLACPEAACLAPAWSPDGRQIAFERRPVWSGAPNLDPQAGRLYLLDVEQGDERPLFDYDVALHSAVWAPAVAGSRLAYISPLLPGIETYDLATGDIQSFGNEWGGPPAWSPDGTRLALADLAVLEEPAAAADREHNESLVVHMLRVDLATGQMTNLTEAAGDALLVKDSGPAWSPAGGWIAFSRQSFEGEGWTPGRQVWLIRPDGSEAYELFHEPAGDHFGLAWRPDGAALAYLQTDLSQGVQAEPTVRVWVFDLTTRQPALVGEGVMARWLP